MADTRCEHCDALLEKLRVAEVVRDDARRAAQARLDDLRAVPKITGDTSDGYHTFNELYGHRISLFLALCNKVKDDLYVWCSEIHSDGTSIPGWFVMGINSKSGTQITYHLPMEHWTDACTIADERLRAPEFDGHTSADVLDRLRKLR